MIQLFKTLILKLGGVVKVLLSLFLSLLLFSLSSAACPPETPLAEVNGAPIALSYYRFVESRTPRPTLERFYRRDPKSLLNRILDRALILAWAQREGFFESPQIKKRLQRFRIKRLAYLYLSSKLNSAPPSNLLSQRRELIASVERKLEDLNLSPKSPSSAVARFEGRKITLGELSPLITGTPTPEKLKRASLDYSLYLLALKEGLDKTADFQNLLRWFKESLAVKAFSRELRSKIKVSDRQIKSYYESHKGEFKLPGRAKVEVWKFKNLSEAKRALSLLKRGEVNKLPKPRRWLLFSGEKGNPVSKLVFSSNKEINLLKLPSGEVLIVKTLSKIPPRPMPYGDAYPEVKGRLASLKFKELLEKELSSLKRDFGLKIYKENLNCLGQENPH